MTFYLYDTAANDFVSIGVPSEDNDRVTDLHFFSDTSEAIGWRAPVAFGFEEDRRKPHGDFPSLANYSKVPVVTERAWRLLQPLIGYCCEVLPVVHPSGQSHFFIHVMETIDALDVERAEINRSKIDGRINRIYKYAFKPGLLEGKHIFKLPLESGADLLVDDEFRKVVEENGLKGLRFSPIPMADD